MQKQENPRKQGWSPNRHALRVNASKRFNDEHEKDSPRTPKRRGTGSSSKRSSQLDRDQTVAGIRPEDVLGKGGLDGNEPSQLLESSDATDGNSNEQADVKSTMRVWRGVNWQEMKKSDSYSSPLASPFTVTSPGKEQPLARGLRRQSSLLKTRNPRPTSRADQSGPDQGSPSQVEDHASQSDHNIDKTSNGDNETVSDKGKKADKTGTLSETSSSSHNNERDSLESQPQSSASKPKQINASLIQNLVEGQRDPETYETKDAPDISLTTSTREDVSHDSRPRSPGRDHIKKPDPQDQGKSPDIPIPGTMESKSENIRSSDPQLKSLGDNQMKSPDPNIRSPDPRGVINEKNPTQDQVGEDVDAAAWLDSDAPLPGNKALSRDIQFAESHKTDHSGSSVDSLIISPTKTDGYGISEEEDYDGITRANAKLMRMFDEYKANYQLKPSFDEKQKARDERAAAKEADKRNRRSRRRNSALASMSSLSSDGSLLLSPGQYDEKSRTDAESVQDSLEMAQEEEDKRESQAALHRIQLYRVNYALQREIEAKDAKFKREIRQAWTQPRPPPTSDEKYLDRVALEKINSKDIFDEFGEQQRPIRTDPQMVSRETHINTMITCARTQFLLEDYRQMYNHANHAFEAASKLEFPPLTARCCYYRGLAMYLHRDFTSAKKDFLEARGCAGLYGISSESIERYIHLIVSAENEETAILEQYPARKDNGGRNASRTRRSRHSDTDIENESSPSTATDVTTLVGDSPRSPAHRASPPFPFGSPAQPERPPGQAHENSSSQTQASRTPNPFAALPPSQDPHPPINPIPTYQPRHEALSEEIRLDIQERKARSLSATSLANPPDPPPREEEPAPASSIASTSTQGAVAGSTTSPVSARRLRRPHIATMTTAFAAAEAGDEEEVRPSEMDPEEIYASFGGRRRMKPRRKKKKKATTDSASASDSAKSARHHMSFR